MANEKQCNQCGITKPATVEFFHRLKAGLQAKCKPCVLVCRAAYYKANRDRIVEEERLRNHNDPRTIERERKRTAEKSKQRKERREMIRQEPTLKCYRCKNVFPKTLEFFCPDKTKVKNGGFTSDCKDCRTEARKTLYDPKKRQKQKERNSLGLCMHCIEPLAPGSKNFCLKHIQRAKDLRQNLRRDIYEHYGNKCACCGESDVRFLSIDHVNNNGAEERRQSRSRFTGVGICRHIQRNNYPTDYQLLCFNCNFAKGIYGTCPHRLDLLEASSSSSSLRRHSS